MRFTLEFRARVGCQEGAMASMAATDSQRTADAEPNGKLRSQLSTRNGGAVALSMNLSLSWSAFQIPLRIAVSRQVRSVPSWWRRRSIRNADGARAPDANRSMISSSRTVAESATVLPYRFHFSRSCDAACIHVPRSLGSACREQVDGHSNYTHNMSLLLIQMQRTYVSYVDLSRYI
jgi:hypothetical protein